MAYLLFRGHKATSMFVNKKGSPRSQALRVSAMDQLSSVKPSAPQQGGLACIPSWTLLDVSAAE